MSDFDKFWSEYPRKISKKDAKKAWDKILPHIDIVLAAIEKQKKYMWKSEVKYIPYPATWIRGERWDDEVDVPFEKKVDPNLERKMQQKTQDMLRLAGLDLEKKRLDR